MASSQDSMAGMPIVRMAKPPLEFASWSFTDSKPSMMIEHDVKHTHVWTIGDIRKKIKMENKCFLESDEFSIKIGDKIIDWCLRIYPNGIDDANIGHISVALMKITNTDLPVDAKYVITFVDNNGVKGESWISEYTFDDRGTGWGVGNGKFLSHAKLREFFPDDDTDSLTVMGEVNIKGGGVSLVASGASGILVPGGNEEASARKCLEDMGNLFNAGKFTDVTIVCQGEGKEFQCHKAVLAGRSPVFEAMFSHNMKEAEENKVTVEDIDGDTLEEMLIFMYSGKVKNLQEKAAELLAAAEKYQLMDLKQRCEESLSINLKVDNVLDVLVTAYLHDASNLQTLAMKFIGENAKEVSAQKGWREKLIQLQRMYPEMMADVIDVIIQK